MAIAPNIITDDHSTWRLLTAQEFIDICGGKLLTDINYQEFYSPNLGQKVVTIDKIIINEQVVFPNFFKTDYAIIIKGGKFNFAVNIYEGEFKSNFSIFNGEFKNGLDIIGGKFLLGFIIQNGKFDGAFNVRGTEFNWYFRISGGEFNNSCLIDGVKSKGFFSIDGGEFNGDFNVQSAECDNDFNIQGGKFNRNFTINRSKFNGNFNIQGEEFTKKFIIYNGDFIGFFAIRKSKFKGFEINGGSFKETVLISGGNFESFISKNTIQGNKIIFESGYITDSLQFLDGGFQEILIEKSEWKKFLFINKIVFKQNTPAIINLLNGYFNDLVFENSVAVKDTIIQVNDISLNQLRFKAHNNLGYIHFNNVTPRNYRLQCVEGATEMETSSTNEIATSKFSLIRSSLGKIEFVNCQLEKFELFVFESSNLLQMFLAGSSFPNEIATTPENGMQYWHEQQQLGYAQLKKVYQNQGNLVNATKYYALEMSAYQKTLPKGWRKNTGEKITLRANQWSNKFGSSWTQGLWFVAYWSLALYWIYCYCLGFRISIDDGAFDRFIKVGSHIFEFILPFHKFDFLKEAYPLTTESAVAPFIDFVGRIVISFGIYQLIQAFRKHGKSS